MKKEDKLVGITIVPGKGLGMAYFVGKGVELPSKVSISRQNVGEQIMLFNAIREKAKKEYQALNEVHGTLPQGNASASIIGIYEQILDDPSFIGQVVETISTKLFDLETAIRLVLNDFVSRFNAAGTSYLKERSGDIVEVCEKLISFLHDDDGRKKSFLEPVVLIVLRMFTPSDILTYDKSNIQAVVCVSGGKTSHAAILARAYSIPVVSGIRDLQKHIYPGEQVYVDADKATVYIRPSPAIAGKAVKSKTAADEYDKLKAKWRRPVYTRDGIQIEVVANVSLPEDVEEANDCGADGVGLVRTEYLLSNMRNFP
ncbi:MAG TPA: PEP-utilizing enzyme, partial [Chitinivibrionales bacterium]